jgi:hypothetical protein
VIRYTIPLIIFILAFLPLLALLIVSFISLLGGKAYFKNNLLGIDQHLNVIFKGDPDETISSRLGKAIRYNGLSAKKWTIAFWLYVILNKIQPNHCEISIEDDEGSNSIKD